MKTQRLANLILSSMVAIGLFALLAYDSNKVRAQLSQPGQAPSLGARIEQLLLREDGLSFTLITPEFVQSPGGEIHVPGLDLRLQGDGVPGLPYYSTLVALPPQADLRVKTVGYGQSLSSVSLVPPVSLSSASDNLQNSPAPIASNDSFDLLADPGSIQDTLPDAAVYMVDRLYPAEIYSVSEPMYYRDLRLVELRIYPLRYNPLSGSLLLVENVDVVLSYNSKSIGPLKPAASFGDRYQQGIADLVVNFDQAANWRSLPPMAAAVSSLTVPIGSDAYKIELAQDGIYEISGADLQSAGMDIANTDPSTLVMMHRGEPVSFQFLGDSDAVLEPAERIRFYGWKFEGPRAEKQFVVNNVYWIWSGGSPTTVQSIANEAGLAYPVVNNFTSSITREPENIYFATWNDWQGAPNEPDGWYWDYLAKGGSPLLRNYTITLPYPAAQGPDATYLAELSSRSNYLPPSQPHVVNAYINSYPISGTTSWYGRANVNVSNTVPITWLLNGVNTVTVEIATQLGDLNYLNRITVDYLRQLIASDNQLIFTDDFGGSREFEVAGMSEGNAAQALVWDISNPSHPINIAMKPGDINGSPGNYTYSVGTTHAAAGAKLIVTTEANVLTSAQLSQYTAPDLDPPGKEAEWLAITYDGVLTQANRLAAYRATTGPAPLKTHVVDVTDIINQYGFGLPLPAAIRSYLSNAIATWTLPPSYLIFIGDATFNPKNLDCLAACSAWDKDEPNLVLTDISFKDRFQGLVPTDHTFSTIVGNDILPDIAVGRLPVGSQAEADAVIDKIILYETNQLTPQAWQRNLLYVADNTDDGGDFCSANQQTANYADSSFNQVHLCLNPSGPITDVATLRPLMSTEVNTNGVTIMSYRGHGAINRWASEGILYATTTDFWDNPDKPVVILSADCHDTQYAWPARHGLGESFLRLDGVGSAAHWGSTGLGFTGEHTVLHTGLLDGVFQMGLTAIGDAINFSKTRYSVWGYHESEMYTFNLLGDPAMQLYRPDVTISKNAVQTEVKPDEQVNFTFNLANNGVYPARLTLIDQLPAGLMFQGISSQLPLGVVANNGIVTITLTNPLSWGQSTVVTLTTTVAPGFLGVATNQVTVKHGGMNLSGVNPPSDSASVTVSESAVTGLAAANDGPTQLGGTTGLSASIVTGSNVTYQWDYGDGTTGAGKVTTHVYPTFGTFQATVTATNSITELTAQTIVLVQSPIAHYLPVISKP